MKTSFLKILTVMFVVLCSLDMNNAAAQSSRPNIIFILADDYGLSDMGNSYGGIYSTPNLDGLAATGTRFDCCFGEPECAPSRAALMTGQYPFRNGCVDQPTAKFVSPTEDGCVAQVMKKAGYKTGIAGKWHQLTKLSTPAEGAAWGFDEFLVWPGRENRYHDAVLNRNGVLETVPYGPDSLNDFAIDFIRKHKSEPFFFYYPMVSIHILLEPTPDNPTATDKELYPDNIKYMDKLIGKLIAELEAQGIRDNTLIVFAGDNGSAKLGTTYGRTIDGKKHSILEGGSRVPLIANWPGKTPISVKKDLIDFTDFLPTFAELGGAALPTDKVFDGHSFAPQIKGLAGTPREWVYIEYVTDPGYAPQRYARDPLWKLMGTGELYEMSDAPYAQTLAPTDTTNAAAKAARTKLQGVLNSMIIGAPANLAPKAIATATPSSGYAPLTVSFSGASSTDTDGSIVSYSWDFGDGATAAGITTSHIYSTTGSYLAILTVTDDKGASNSAATTITTTSVSSSVVVDLGVIDNFASEAGSDLGKFKISRTGATTTALTVNYQMAGTASNGIDYQTLSGTATIPAGAAYVMIPVTPINDTLIEGEELVTMKLLAGSGYSVGAASKNVSIFDDEQSIVKIKASDSIATEGNGAADMGVFTFTRTAPFISALTVHYSIQGRAINGTDYELIPTSVVIPAGASSATLSIISKDDALVEGAEAVKLYLAADSEYQLDNSTGAAVSILDND
jgi:arylsulfatase A